MELNYRSPRLLHERGFTYDSSLMDADLPYELAVEPDSGAATAGYAGSNAASGSDGSASIVEIPIHWGLDDWEQYCYIPACSVPD